MISTDGVSPGDVGTVRLQFPRGGGHDVDDASGGQLTATSTVDDLARLDFNKVDQVNGPIAVVGAEPGDTLQVDLLEFEPADWGWTASIPGFGLLADDFRDPALRISRVPGVGGRAEFLPG